MNMDDTRRAEWVRESVSRFAGPLTRYAQVITGDLELARDIVQETFIRLCDEKPERVNSHLAQWLFTVCRNRALDLQRKRSRMQSLSPVEMNAQASPEPSPSAQAEKNETDGELLSLMARLPKNQEEVVRLKFQNGLSYREIAAVTGLSTSNVGFLIHTAIKTLRDQMKSEPTRKTP
jgi:RNA polymerase sigma-70 factor (ECF subfamily)